LVLVAAAVAVGDTTPQMLSQVVDAEGLVGLYLANGSKHLNLLEL
jgi:hypothetical protein